MAVKEGTQIAVSEKLEKVVFEMDSQIVHAEVTGISKHKNWKLMPICTDICALLNLLFSGNSE